eukprot:scaffold19.g1816.t1
MPPSLNPSPSLFKERQATLRMLNLSAAASSREGMKEGKTPSLASPATPRSPSTPAGPASVAAANIEGPSNRHVPALFLGYTAAAGVAAYAALGHASPDLFRAPLLDRHVGVDVGQRVFRAQYSIEGALTLTAAGLLCAKAGGLGGLAALVAPEGRALAAACAVLAMEAAFVTPALSLRSKHLILESTAGQLDRLTSRQQQYVEELRAHAAARPSPPAQLHLLSVGLALAKAALLATYAAQLVRVVGAA